jgi:hypothetical protein
MRSFLSNFRLIRCLALLMLATLSEAHATGHMIYGIENAQHFVGSDTEYYYIKLNSFNSKEEADQVYQYLNTGFISVRVRPYHGVYQVTLGPIYSAQEVREVGHELSAMPAPRPRPTTPTRPQLMTYPIAPIPPVKNIEPISPRETNTPRAKTTTKTMAIAMRRSLAGVFSHPVFTLSGGAAWSQGGGRKTLYLQPELFKTFNPNASNQSMFTGDLLIGKQYPITPQLIGQLGLALGMTSDIKQSGDIWEQGYPEFDNYTYQYAIHQTRVLIKGKLLTIPLYYQLSPYISAGVGVGFNRMHGYHSTPKIEEESPQPPFADNTTTSATYTLGAGLQRSLGANWSVGTGYEFSAWGKSTLAQAAGQTINQGLGVSSLHTNGILINITYLG